MNKDTAEEDNKVNILPGFIHNSNESESSSSLSCYEEYLNLLQERNRTRRKLKKKSQTQLALERREKGFTLYLNGANAEKEKILSPVVCRKNKDNEGLYLRDYNSNSNGLSPKTCRKNWMVQNLNVKTQDGKNLKILAPKTSSSSISYKSSDSSLDSNENLTSDDFNDENEYEIEEEIVSSSDSKSEDLTKSVSSPELSAISRTSEVKSSNWWHNNRNNLKSFSQTFFNNSNQIKMNTDDDFNIIELESTPKRTNKRLQSANYIKQNDSIDLQSNVMNDILQAIEAENQSIEKNATKMVENSCASKNDCDICPLQPKIRNINATIVSMEIVSNWGHPNRVGLTEIQFFDQNQKLILIEDIKVIGAFDPKGELSNLHNNKMRTVKERHMWSCSLRCDPIYLEFVLSPVSQEPRLIKVWNFNHNIKDLLIGARQIRICVNGLLRFDGILEKGCGNQVFDYSHAIKLVDDESLEVTSSVTELIKNLVFDNNKSPVKEEKSDILPPIMETSHILFEKSKKQPARRSQSGLNLKTNESDDNVNINLNNPPRMKSSISLNNYQTNLTKPKWLDTYPKEKNPHKKPSWLQGLDINLKEPLMDPGEMSETNSRCGSGTSLGGRPKRYDSESQLDLHSSEDMKLFLDNDESRSSREGSAKYGRRAIPSPIPSSGDPQRRAQTLSQGSRMIEEKETQREESARLRTKKNFDRTLEESWTSLHIFDQCHRGRLSLNMEGDVMDTYLNSEKHTKVQVNFNNLHDVDSSSFENCNCGFIIPELPQGIDLVVNIRTTWGDRHYVGLNGIEIFSSSGEAVKVKKITANPEDINILPEYSKDPRVVSNLVDGVYRTRDDMHLWLTPFSRGSEHLIFIHLEKHVKIAMIRIWNYNKSRIHSFRGAKDIEITLDRMCIFKGEIARACGGIRGGIEAFGDTILFTTDDDILESIAKHDQTFSCYTCDPTETVKEEIIFERPRTGHIISEDGRPLTSAAPKFDRNQTEWEKNLHDDITYSGEVLELNALSNWGDPDLIGLTGLEVMDQVGESVPFSVSALSTNLNDSHANKTLARLIDRNYVTTSDQHMWATNYSEGLDHKIIIKFKQSVTISGIRIWNYNRSLEDSYRGVKYMQVILNGKLLSPEEGFLIRKGPGNCHFDYAQEVKFAGPPAFSLATPTLSGKNVKYSYDQFTTLDYEAPVMPRGFVFQFQLYSTWGDPYYVGLNGLEFYDATGNQIPLTENNVAAYPDSVNVLDNVHNDVRTPDKLIDGINDTLNGHHMWLAPVLPSVMNRIYIIFDYPVTVSMIKLWNYSKTPARSVKEFGLLVDDLLVYHNMLNQITLDELKKNPTSIPHHSILFTADKEIIQQEKNSALRNNYLDQDVQLTNDYQVVHRGTSGKIVDQTLRPMTSLPPSK